MQNLNAEVDALGSEMRAFMQATNGQRTEAPTSGDWVPQMMTGTANRTPLQRHAPSVNMGVDLESDYGRTALGTAVAAELVVVVKPQP